MVRAVASFTRLSPSKMITSRRGRPSRRAIDVAAMASGGETMAPSAMAAGQPSCGARAIATAATARVVVKTRPTARRLIGRTLRHSSRGPREYEAENRIGGRKRASTTSGASSKRPRNGSTPRPSPATTIRIGYGTPSRWASSVTAATTARNRRTSSSTSTGAASVEDSRMSASLLHALRPGRDRAGVQRYLHRGCCPVKAG